MSISMDREGIMKVIPHRDPMLLVDEVVSMEPEKEINTKFYVGPEREIFKGHFPGDPVLPGVYTVEIMAQSSDILILSMDRYAGKTPLFIGINNVKFKSPIRPDHPLEIHSANTHEREEKAIVTCSAEVYDAGTLACTGDVTLAMR